MREIFKEVRGIFGELIIKRERAMQAGSGGMNDLLGLLLESNLERLQEDGNSKGVRMTTDEVIEECKLFYAAGEENTAGLLTWTIVALGMHPDWQERARAEVLKVFGKNNDLVFDGLGQLKIVTMVLYEVLRLYPPIISTNRVTRKATKVGGYTFPAGVQLFLPILFIHHDPEFWGDDAVKFKPERFAEGVSRASENHLAPFFPFGGGPRTCLGNNFAMIEAKLCLAMILQRFSFDISPTYVHAPYTAVTLQPQHGAPVVLRKL
ncbi:hypothetical protein Taro_041839, partial [Colocasia esculenta]|nr:hypothetical protein [Colocasia esculenta]